jgi:hypothetical protein
MKEKIIQGVFVAWMTVVLATHWMLLGGPVLKSAGAKASFLHTAKEVLSSWFYASYGH